VSAALDRRYPVSGSAPFAEPASAPSANPVRVTMYFSWRQCLGLAMTLLRAALLQGGASLHCERLENGSLWTVLTPGEDMFRGTCSYWQGR
jgi:hypothetical protein